MSKIDKIIIATYAGDFWLTKICVASIRKWYPEIPIVLIKDVLKGDFCTREIEEHHGVGILDLPRNRFGWGVSKFEPYFFKTRERVMIIDADTLFVGPLLEGLEKLDDDFVITPEYPEDPTADWFKGTYYDLDRIRSTFDSDFQYPGYVFNTGQLVCYTGLFEREDFDPYVNYDGVPTMKRGDTLKCADQGILNYFLPVLERQKKISIGHLQFMTWSKSEKAQTFELEEIARGRGYPTMLHWAGDNANYIEKLTRSDLVPFPEGILQGHPGRRTQAASVQFPAHAPALPGAHHRPLSEDLAGLSALRKGAAANQRKLTLYE